MLVRRPREPQRSTVGGELVVEGAQVVAGNVSTTPHCSPLRQRPVRGHCWDRPPLPRDSNLRPSVEKTLGVVGDGMAPERHERMRQTASSRDRQQSRVNSSVWSSVCLSNASGR